MCKCCICENEIKGYGNSALPLINGLCCDKCNNDYVILARQYELKLYSRQIEDYLQKNNPSPKIGAKVLILNMKNEPDYSGKNGIIEFVDDIGQLHGTWGGCALIPNVDVYIIVSTRKED